MSKARFILFDIDGTLIDAGGAGRRALTSSFNGVFGVSDGFKGIKFAGKTDLQIIKEGIKHKGFPVHNGIISSMIDLYLKYLVIEMENKGKFIYPGIMRLLRAIQSRGNTYLGLLTGNLEKGARIKLEPFGLNQFFPVGAFGSDHEDREKLLPIAVGRLGNLQGIGIGFSDCIVIGDTPRDVECAKICGSLSIAVATGPYSTGELSNTEADLVVSDLSDTEQILERIDRGC